MKLTPYLEKAVITVGLRESDIRLILSSLVDSLAKAGSDIDGQQVIDDLIKREGYCSTGIGMGLAIPHAMVEGLDSTQMAIATLADPVEFNSIDKRPVKLVILLLGPKGETVEHLALLARIARLCSDEVFLELLIQAENPEDLLNLFIDEDENRVG